MNEDLDGPLLAALRIVAAGLDRIDPAASPIGAQRLSRELRALTEALRRTPDARDAGRDSLAEFLTSLSTPELAPTGNP